MILYRGPAEGFVDEETRDGVEVIGCKVRFPGNQDVFVIAKITDLWDDGRTVYNATKNGSFAFHLSSGQKFEIVE
jgi:hypothetical protein